MSLSARPCQGGFSLLEAIVALVVLTLVLLPLLGWMSGSLAAIERSQVALERAQLQQMALEVAKTINPWRDPTGRLVLPPYVVSWRSTPLTETVMGKTPVGAPSAFDLRLFEVELNVSREGLPPAQVTTRRAGWVVARPMIEADG